MERIPPHSEEAERSAIGAAMLSKDALLDVAEEVRPEDFYNESNKEIFDAILKLYRNNTAVDLLTVSEELSKRKTLDMVGGRAYLAMLTADVPSTANAGEYAKIVAEKAVTRRLIAASEEIVARGYEDKTSAEELLDKAESDIFHIAQKRQKNDYVKIQDVLLNNVKMIDEAVQNKGNITGLTTGFKQIDEMTAGLQPGNLVIIAGRPGMGKTAFALNIAERSAINAGASVLIFSIEMPAEEIGQRLISMHGRIESEKLKKGNLDVSDWENINYALNALNGTKIVIDSTQSITVTEMRNKCRRLKLEQGLDLVVVDYLQLMKGDDRSPRTGSRRSAPFQGT